jgi:hypothetical protein
VESVLGADEILYLDHMYVKFDNMIVAETTVDGLLTSKFLCGIPAIKDETSHSVVSYNGPLDAGQIIRRSCFGHGNFHPVNNNCSHFAKRVFSTLGFDLDDHVRANGGVCSLLARNLTVSQKLLDAKFPAVMSFIENEPGLAKELFRRNPSLRRPTSTGEGEGGLVLLLLLLALGGLAGKK